jgi:hypothetical protein
MQLEQAVQRAAEWLSLSGVEGVGVGEAEGQPCILVLVSNPAQVPAGIPRRFHGFPVQIRSTGAFRAV